MPLYRLLLHLFPASFRAEYGDEMQSVFAGRRRNENPIALWLSTLFDIATNALRVHFDLLQQDLRWTLRVLRQSPGFTATAIVVAALGMGANTAAFTLLDHVLLRPLPYADPARLVTLYQTQTAAGYRDPLSPPNYLDYRAMNKSFETIAAYSGLSINLADNLAGQGDPQRLEGANIAASLFGLLGVQPALGRAFIPDDERDGTPDSVILSDHLWRAKFNADPAVLGRTIRLDDAPFTIVGVMPPGFAFPTRAAELWVPLRFPGFLAKERANTYLGAIARLRRGLSIEQAQADLNVIAAQLARSYPDDDTGVGASVVSLRDVISPQSRMLVVTVFGAAFCVLLIACTNLANLLLARSITRKREIAVRIAIGGARERLLRQLLTENLVLAVAGGALGLALAYVATPFLAWLVPDALPIGSVPPMDLRVFAFAAALTIFTSIVFGVGPAYASCSRADMNALRGKSASTKSSRVRSALVLAEVAGTVTLLVAAGLLVKALWRVQSVDPGFRPDGVLTLRTALPMPKYSATAERARFYSQVLADARALPGVTSASYISFLPMVNRAGIWNITTPGMSPEEARRAKVSLRFVTPGFFDALRIPIKAGRDVSDRDTSTAPFVAVVSESFARKYWPNQDPLGRQFNVAFFDRTIVGIVADIAVRGLDRSSEPQIYLPSPQVPDNFLTWYAPKDLVIRTSSDTAALALAPALREIIRKADPEQAVADLQLLSNIVASETTTRRAQLNLLGAFAAIAFLLAAVGVHGLLSFAVSTRTSEVGVRLALGARPANILNMFLRQGLVLGVAGVALALPLSYFAATAMTSLLFGVQPSDPIIYTSAALLALTMAAIGSLRPALHASAIDPAITIRSE